MVVKLKKISKVIFFVKNADLKINKINSSIFR